MTILKAEGFWSFGLYQACLASFSTWLVLSSVCSKVWIVCVHSVNRGIQWTQAQLTRGQREMSQVWYPGFVGYVIFLADWPERRGLLWFLWLTLPRSVCWGREVEGATEETGRQWGLGLGQNFSCHSLPWEEKLKKPWLRELLAKSKSKGRLNVAGCWA